MAEESRLRNEKKKQICFTISETISNRLDEFFLSFSLQENFLKIARSNNFKIIKITFVEKRQKYRNKERIDKIQNTFVVIIYTNNALLIGYADSKSTWQDFFLDMCIE